MPTPVTKEEPTQPVLVPFTCPWAQDGLRRALEGLTGSSSGVKGYKIGTRAVEYQSVGDQNKVVEYWQRMVDIYCVGQGEMPMPGKDSAIRVIPRDV